MLTVSEQRREIALRTDWCEIGMVAVAVVQGPPLGLARAAAVGDVWGRTHLLAAAAAVFCYGPCAGARARVRARARRRRRRVLAWGLVLGQRYGRA